MSLSLSVSVGQYVSIQYVLERYYCLTNNLTNILRGLGFGSIFKACGIMKDFFALIVICDSSANVGLFFALLFIYSPMFV